MLELGTQFYASNTFISFEKGLSLPAMSSGGVLLLYLIGFVILVLSIVAEWKIFEKAGVAGWKVLVPFYNFWLLAEIAGKPGWLSLAALALVIPFFGAIIFWIVELIINIGLANKFGKNKFFAVLLLVILQPIGKIILGFGDAKYERKKVSSAKRRVKNSKAKRIDKAKATK